MKGISDLHAISNGMCERHIFLGCCKELFEMFTTGHSVRSVRESNLEEVFRKLEVSPVCYVSYCLISFENGFLRTKKHTENICKTTEPSRIGNVDTWNICLQSGPVEKRVTRFHQEEIQETTEYRASAERIIRMICSRAESSAASIELSMTVASSNNTGFEVKIDVMHALSVSHERI